MSQPTETGWYWARLKPEWVASNRCELPDGWGPMLVSPLEAPGKSWDGALYARLYGKPDTWHNLRLFEFGPRIPDPPADEAALSRARPHDDDDRPNSPEDIGGRGRPGGWTGGVPGR